METWERRRDKYRKRIHLWCRGNGFLGLPQIRLQISAPQIFHRPGSSEEIASIFGWFQKWCSVYTVCFVCCTIWIDTIEQLLSVWDDRISNRIGVVCIYLEKMSLWNSESSGTVIRHLAIISLTTYTQFFSHSGRRVVTTRGPMATDEGCDQIGHYLQRSNDWIVYLFIYQKWNTKKSQNHDFGGNDLVDVLHKPPPGDLRTSPLWTIELKAAKEVFIVPFASFIVPFAFYFTTLIVRRQANFHNRALGKKRTNCGGNKMWLYVVT